jgi:hypothetical protein
VVQSANEVRDIAARQIDAGNEGQPVADQNDLLMLRSTARVFGVPNPR